MEYCDDICAHWIDHHCSMRHRPLFRVPEGYEDIMATPPNWGWYKPKCKDLVLNEVTVQQRKERAEQKKWAPFDMDLLLLEEQHENRPDWYPSDN